MASFRFKDLDVDCQALVVEHFLLEGIPQTPTVGGLVAVKDELSAQLTNTILAFASLPCYLHSVLGQYQRGIVRALKVLEIAQKFNSVDRPWNYMDDDYLADTRWVCRELRRVEAWKLRLKEEVCLCIRL